VSGGERGGLSRNGVVVDTTAERVATSGVEADGADGEGGTCSETSSAVSIGLVGASAGSDVGSAEGGTCSATNITARDWAGVGTVSNGVGRAQTSNSRMVDATLDGVATGGIRTLSGGAGIGIGGTPSETCGVVLELGERALTCTSDELTIRLTSSATNTMAVETRVLTVSIVEGGVGGDTSVVVATVEGVAGLVQRSAQRDPRSLNQTLSARCILAEGGNIINKTT